MPNGGMQPQPVPDPETHLRHIIGSLTTKRLEALEHLSRVDPNKLFDWLSRKQIPNQLFRTAITSISQELAERKLFLSAHPGADEPAVTAAEISRLGRIIRHTGLPSAISRLSRIMPTSLLQRPVMIGGMSAIGGVAGTITGGLPGGLIGSLIGAAAGTAMPLPPATPTPPTGFSLKGILSGFRLPGLIGSEVFLRSQLGVGLVSAIGGLAARKITEMAAERQQQLSTLEGGHGAAVTGDKTLAGLIQRISSQSRLYPGARW